MNDFLALAKGILNHEVVPAFWKTMKKLTDRCTQKMPKIRQKLKKIRDFCCSDDFYIMLSFLQVLLQFLLVCDLLKKIRSDRAEE